MPKGIDKLTHRYYHMWDMNKVIKIGKYHCNKCNHEWIPRQADYPRICPKCKSVRWDKPVKEE